MKKSIALICTVVLMVSLFSGCGNETEQNKVNANFKKTTSDEYPLKSDETLTWWCVFTGAANEHSRSLNDTPFAKGLIERVGVNIDFIHASVGADQFNLMIASGEIPDIIEYDWVKDYPGGPGKAIKEGTIISLNGIMEEVSPNLNKIFKEHPDYEKQLRTENGDLYMYPFIISTDRLRTYMGGMVRGDLLEKAGLSEPETIDDWDTMLRTFKSMGIETPLTLKLDNKNLEDVSAFMGAYGILGGFFVDNGKVKFGPYEEAFGDYVSLMSGWYRDGLLDTNFTDTDKKRVAALVASGECGAIFGSGGGDFGTFIPALTQNNPGASFVPVKYPVLDKGDRPLGQKNLPVKANGASISGKCKNVELAARVLDYGYSEAGHMYYNFGIEGESYTMVDGNPVYKPEVIDPEKNGNLSVAGGLTKYVRASYNGPFVQDERYIDQFYTLPEQREAVTIWSDTDTLNYKLPICYMTDAENKEYSNIMQDINVYREETFYKTVSGKMTVQEFKDAYFQELKDRGIERAIEICQAAYDRYKAQ